MAKGKPERTRRTERAEATRRRVLDAAVQLFIQRGFHATTIESIAAAADVSVETVYKRFADCFASMADRRRFHMKICQSRRSVRTMCWFASRLVR